MKEDEGADIDKLLADDPRLAIIKAAKSRDIDLLRYVLEKGISPNLCLAGPQDNAWAIPLTTSILAGLPVHADLLIELGADPDGFSAWNLECYSSNYLRGRSPAITHTWPVGAPIRKEVELQYGSLDTQDAPITSDEVVARLSTRSRFYSEPDFPSMVHPPCATLPVSPFEAAAKVGDVEMMLKLSNNAHADVSAWRRQKKAISPSVTRSTLSVLTPLHHAIQSENLDTVKFLLDQGHRADIFPLVTITRSFNAAMYAVTKTPSWIEGLQIIAPTTDFSLRTPIYECSILHLATAKLDPTLLKSVLEITKIDPLSLEPTALKHTCIHIACMPLDETYINVHAWKIYASIHDVRTFRETWKPQPLWPPGLGRKPRQRALVELWPRTADPSENVNDTVQMLLGFSDDPRAELCKQDYCGNTPLHYLAGNRIVNEDLLSSLKALSPGSWDSTENAFGHTAKDLYENGIEARESWNAQHMPFWQDPYGLWTANGKWIDWHVHPGKRFP